MGPGKYEDVGKSQSVLIMINPSTFTRTRMPAHLLQKRVLGVGAHGGKQQRHASALRDRAHVVLLRLARQLVARQAGQRLAAAPLQLPAEAAALPPSIFLDQNRPVIGDFQSKRNRIEDGNASLTRTPCGRRTRAGGAGA
jgi:hypothetical protein